MGTRLDILMPGTDDEPADQICKEIRIEMDRLEKMLSIYRNDSLFSFLNENAARSNCPVDQEVFDLFSQLAGFHHLTLGYFDITMGTGIDHSREVKEGQVPDQGIVLDVANCTVGFNSPRINIDSGAFGKGLALNSIKKILGQSKIYNAFVSFGESSVLTLGHHPYGDHWKVGIKDMFRTDRNVFVFDINDGSVSSSGNSLNNETKYPEGHIVNPYSGNKVEGYQLVCVAGPDAMEAEVLSTALILAGDDERAVILGNFSGYTAVKISYPGKNADPVLEKL